MAVAARGFEAIEVFATRTHFDYHNAEAIGQLESWLRESGLYLHGIHAPITESLVGDRWGPGFSTAMSQADQRRAAVRETEAALNIARRIPTTVLVVHLGTPRGQHQESGDNDRAAVRRSLEEIQRVVEPVGVRLALEIIPNELSTAASLTRLLEEELDLPHAGICMDFGHAFLMGDLVDAIETTSGHLITTHVHDNHGSRDEHLAPFDGSIDWAAALMATQKIGYDGTWLMELRNTSTPDAVLDAAQHVRRRFERLLG